MDSTLSHEAVARFEALEENVRRLFSHAKESGADVTTVEEDNEKAAADVAAAAAASQPVDPRDAKIAELEAKLAAQQAPVEEVEE